MRTLTRNIEAVSLVFLLAMGQVCPCQLDGFAPHAVAAKNTSESAAHGCCHQGRPPSDREAMASQAPATSPCCCGGDETLIPGLCRTPSAFVDDPLTPLHADIAAGQFAVAVDFAFPEASRPTLQPPNTRVPHTPFFILNSCLRI